MFAALAGSDGDSSRRVALLPDRRGDAGGLYSIARIMLRTMG
jgi:hypothetical protein